MKDYLLMCLYEKSMVNLVKSLKNLFINHIIVIIVRISNINPDVFHNIWIVLYVPC